MITGSDAAHLVKAARVVERFVERFDFDSLSGEQRRRARSELAAIETAIADSSPELSAALRRLASRIAEQAGRPRSADPVSARRFTQLLRWLAPLAIAGASLAPLPAAASPTLLMMATLIGTIDVGEQILNPETGLNETVV